MMQTTLALIAFLFPLAFSPGPGNLFFAANGARFGFRATLAANLGYHLATFAMTLLIGLGFVAVIGKYPQLFAALQIAGALYVLWLAWKLFRAGTLAQDGTAQPAGLRDGAVLLLLNPKAYVIMTLMFTQFTHAKGAAPLSLVLLIAAVFTLNNAVAFCAWTVMGDTMARSFRTPRAAHLLNTFLAALLAGIAIWMLLR